MLQKPTFAVTSKPKGGIARVGPNDDLLPTASASGMQATKNDDDTNWEGFDASENGGVVQSDPISVKSGSSSKKSSRKSESAIRKNGLLLQKKESSISKGKAKAGNSFEVLENAVNDEIDGITTKILCHERSC